MKKITKIPILGMNQDDSDALLPLGFCREIRNFIPLRGGLSKAGGGQNIPGTTIRSNPGLAAGVNTEIGSHEDRANNRIFYFLHNSSNNHSIWYFNPNTNAHTKVLQSQYLNFSLSNRISSADCIEDILTWTDGYNEPRSILVADAVANVYSATSSLDYQISLQKFNPPTPADAVRSSDAGVGVNNVASDSYQFAYRFVYRDNCQSFFAPTSKLVRADMYPVLDSNSDNRITLTIPVDSKVVGVVSKVQIAYTKNSSGNYFIFKEIDHDGSTTSYTSYFYNTEAVTAVPAQELTKVNFVPPVSKNVIINSQRIITTMDEYDKDFDDVGTSSLALSLDPYTTTKIHLQSTTYTYGIVYFDGRMRTNGVVATSEISIPQGHGSGSTAVTATDLSVTWTISGNPPAWAIYYAIVRKRNSTIAAMFQVPALALWYIREDDTVASDELLDDGKVYYGTKAAAVAGAGIDAYSGYIYWKIPTNIPASFDNSWRVRMVPSIAETKTEPIVEIIGDKVVTGNFGVTDWSSGAAEFSYPLLQFEKHKDFSEENFFEIGSMHTITSGVHDDLTGTEDGDHFIVSFESFTFEPVEGGSVDYGFPFGPDWMGGYPSATIVSMSTTTSMIPRTTTRTSSTVERIDPGNIFNDAQRFLRGVLDVPQDSPNVTSTTTSDVKQSFTLDYSKVCSDNSRTWVQVKNKRTSREPSTLSISDRYVLNSKINGTNNFSKLYVLPPNRSPVRKLINLGSSNQALAIHERSVTSLATYTGDKILPTSDGSEFELIGEAGSIIGYDREMMGGYGTIYPDSVVQDGGRVWWFDPYKGEICRYNNGITPLASVYKMKTYFKAKGDIFIDPTNRNVVAGYDPVLKMVYFTFVSADTSERETIAFIDKEGEERWFMFLDDQNPEGYAKINSRWFSFVDGVMYEHNVSSDYNLIHGEQQVTKIVPVFNAEWSHEKFVRSIATESTSKWSFPSILVRKNGVNRNQETLLKKTDFVRKDDIYYASLMRDRNTFGLTASQGRIRGDVMVGKAYEITMEQDDTDLSELQYLDVSYQVSPGHKTV